MSIVAEGIQQARVRKKKKYGRQLEKTTMSLPECRHPKSHHFHPGDCGEAKESTSSETTASIIIHDRDWRDQHEGPPQRSPETTSCFSSSHFSSTSKAEEYRRTRVVVDVTKAEGSVEVMAEGVQENDVTPPPSAHRGSTPTAERSASTQTRK
jgi:hypothetical protein